MSAIRETLLNAATAIATVCAVAVAGVRVHDLASAPSDSRLKPARVVDWQQYSASGARIGPASARLTIVEFADFQCPFCRRAAMYLDQLQQRHPTDIAVLYRHYPIHHFARESAIASECARRAGAFKAFHDTLFAEQDSIGREAWTRIALSAGVEDTADFAHCMGDSSAARVVSADSAAGAKLGVWGTPTFLIGDLR